MIDLTDTVTSIISDYNRGYEQGKKDAVVHAQWERRKVKRGDCYFPVVMCSNCFELNSNCESPYCPNCGAKMDEEEE